MSGSYRHYRFEAEDAGHRPSRSRQVARERDDLRTAKQDRAVMMGWLPLDRYSGIIGEDR